MSTMNTLNLFVLALASIGAAAAIVGIFWSARRNVLEDTEGTPYFDPATGWEKHRGPIVGTTGALLGLAPTISGLFDV